MTDENGSDSEPVHEEVPTTEHQAETPDAGVWSDDHPPVDDFADAASVSEETASASHETTGDIDETAMPAPAPARSMLPLFAGIGGILLIGAIIYWQFGHSSPPPMMAMPAAAPKSSSSLASANSKSAAIPPATTKKIEESDITSLYKPPGDAAAATLAAEPAPTTAMAMAPEPVPPPAMPATPMPPAPPVAVASPPAPVTAAMEARMDAMATRMEMLEKLVQADAQQLNQLNNMVAATQAMPPTANQVSPALEDRLNKIEQSLMQIEHNNVIRTPSASTAAEEKTSMTASPEAAAKPAVHHATTKHKHIVSKKIITAHHGMPMAPMPMASTPASGWFLRAATPTEAWVSSDPRSAELRHVQVGDTLTGIGQIRTIRQTPSGWEIEGTTGTIR